MKNALKKTIALLICVIFTLPLSVSVIAEEEYTVRDAYFECAAMYPEFVENIKAQKQNVTDDQLIALLETIRANLLSRQEVIVIDESNFYDELADAVTSAFSMRRHINARDAITAAYPDAVYDASQGVVNEEFRPIYETVRRIIFDHDLAGNITEPTEPEPTEPPSDDESDATEPSAEPTQKPTGSHGIGGGGTGVGPTEKPTDAPTQPPTENTTEKPTSAPTEKPTQSAEDVTFTDMADAAWAQEAVSALVKMGIISGMGDGTFAPNRSITRAEFAKIIVMTSGQYDAKASCEFTDVKSGDWFYSYVASAKNLGLISGRSDTVFDPNAPITRAEICIIVYRYIKSVNSEFGRDVSNAPVFTDAAQIPSYAIEAVTALSAAGIISGMGGGNFSPNTPATRAQSARIVYGAINAAMG